ncbi:MULTISPECIES: hypothetical protein [Bacillus cereus group]|uniref:hypothetical protein n=1 Tax=Bacillus cereus group TaxID=86661 RepID=UPI0022E88DAB|nr:hypothetical protein [Bacillus cereus group sp. TH152-1LC]MDA1674786.1 hypothetical protein [Bacillus cereus group sp. TH152-1LC]
MNIGVFMEEKNKFYLYTFYNFVEKLPLESLGNAMVSLENEGYYTITEIKNRKINPLDFFIIRENKILENPFELSTLQMASLFGEATREFELVDNIVYKDPEFKEFSEELIKKGFYRADNINFKRAMMRDKFERRNKRTI